MNARIKAKARETVLFSCKGAKIVLSEAEKKPTKRYLEYVEPRLNEIKAWAMDGKTEEEIAKLLGIAYSTFRVYKAKNPALSTVLKAARVYDAEVVTSLHKNALGGKVLLITPVKCRRVFYENGKKVKEEEYVVDALREEYIKPDTMAEIYWLNNRMPKHWKAKPVEQPDKDEQAKETAQKDELYEHLLNRKIEGFNEEESNEQDNLQ